MPHLLLVIVSFILHKYICYIYNIHNSQDSFPWVRSSSPVSTPRPTKSPLPSQAKQSTQSKPVSRSSPSTQARPVSRSPLPTQSKPVSRSPLPTQSKPVSRSPLPTKAKPASKSPGKSNHWCQMCSKGETILKKNFKLVHYM